MDMTSATGIVRARSNALLLEEEKGKINRNHDTTCKLCGEEKEDIVHFTIKCCKLEKGRNNTLINRQLEDPIEKMKDLLFRNGKQLEVSIMIRNLCILTLTALDLAILWT